MLLRNIKFTLPLFSAQSAWNQSLSGVATDANNQERLKAIRRMIDDNSKEEGKDLNNLQVNVGDFTIPVCAAERQGTIVRLRTYNGDVWPTHDPASVQNGEITVVPGVPKPAGIVRPAGPTGLKSDGSLALVDFELRESFDMFQATTEYDAGDKSTGGGIPGNQILDAGFVMRYSLDGMGAQIPPEGKVLNSARASGLPLLGGLIIPEDLERLVPEAFSTQTYPAIPHALALAVPGLRCFARGCGPGNPTDFVFPASKAEISRGRPDPFALATGERIRLASHLYFNNEISLIEDQRVAPITKIFFHTLREYGAYAVDGAGAVVFYAEDEQTACLELEDEHLRWLIDREPNSSWTPWQNVIFALQDQLDFELSQRMDLQTLPMPLIVDRPDGTLGNVEVMQPAIPPGA
jgi:hypothetical protein